jgi:hypothetical protein
MDRGAGDLNGFDSNRQGLDCSNRLIQEWHRPNDVRARVFADEPRRQPDWIVIIIVVDARGMSSGVVRRVVPVDQLGMVAIVRVADVQMFGRQESQTRQAQHRQPREQLPPNRHARIMVAEVSAGQRQSSIVTKNSEYGQNRWPNGAGRDQVRADHSSSDGAPPAFATSSCLTRSTLNLWAPAMIFPSVSSKSNDVAFENRV